MSLVLRFRCAVTSAQSCTRSSSQPKAITGTGHYDNLLLSVMDRAYAPLSRCALETLSVHVKSCARQVID